MALQLTDPADARNAAPFKLRLILLAALISALLIARD